MLPQNQDSNHSGMETEFQCLGCQRPENAPQGPGLLFPLTLLLPLVPSLPEAQEHPSKLGPRVLSMTWEGRASCVSLVRSGSVLTEAGMLAPPHPLAATWGTGGFGSGGATTDGAWMTTDCLWQPMPRASRRRSVSPPDLFMWQVDQGSLLSIHSIRVLTSRFPVGPHLQPHPQEEARVTTAPASLQVGLLQAWLDAGRLACGIPQFLA